MALYLVSYDIASYDKAEYPKLWDTLKALGAVKILYSEWVLAAEVGNASSIYTKIAPCVRQQDRLLIQELTNDAYWDKLLISDDAFRTLLKPARG
jgi:hypothetical protein